MQNPSEGVPSQLLPHMHLVSKQRYPTLANLPIETVVDYLLQAPQVMKAGQPVFWHFLESPADGTIMLVWQPLARLGTTFASDGYIWAHEEQGFHFESKGYVVEMGLMRAGYHPPEPMATHSRKRYRLLPPKQPNPSLPQPDPSLYLVHYTRAAPTDTIPSVRIPNTPAIQQSMSVRRWLQSVGQLARKEFMLHDREQWPTINAPPHPQMQPQHGHPQQPPATPGHPMAQPPQAGMAAAQMAPGKGPAAGRPMPHGSDRDTTLLDEDDVSKGDILDFLTPREISKVRYQQHHEWMEEIYSSLYSTEQIIPPSLGLGKKGELESLTKDTFELPIVFRTSKNKDEIKTPAVIGKMEPGKADEFTARANARMAAIKEDIQRMKKKHAERMEKMERTSRVFKDAELRLRNSSGSNGAGIWRSGSADENGEEGSPVKAKETESVKQILEDVASKTGKHVAPVSEVTCVQRGGLQEKVNDGPEEDEPDVNMTNEPEASAPKTELPSSTIPGAQQQGAEAANAAKDGDVQMSDAPGRPANPQTESSADDWVMVNNDDTKPAQPSASTAPSAPSTTVPVPPPTQQQPLAANAALKAPVPAAIPNIETGTPTFDDSAFGDLGTAGEALEAYDNELELDGMDDSAFGDAFQAGQHE